ncbi:hypothetical protein BJ508DRAFT_324258 [Ascobolus immersus RN42]|uniref:Uncharacterized protein n=1 Tax=Ascobolus immersus RN42 TaxID=1160509 RepID=A0A3N4IGU8_ASCIM|nr:hypothetical protein BJ508DRAFT_324258 [Ascobolus immersus RN42]
MAKDRKQQSSTNRNDGRSRPRTRLLSPRGSHSAAHSRCTKKRHSSKKKLLKLKAMSQVTSENNGMPTMKRPSEPFHSTPSGGDTLELLDAQSPPSKRMKRTDRSVSDTTSSTSTASFPPYSVPDSKYSTSSFSTLAGEIQYRLLVGHRRPSLEDPHTQPSTPSGGHTLELPDAQPPPSKRMKRTGRSVPGTSAFPPYTMTDPEYTTLSFSSLASATQYFWFTGHRRPSVEDPHTQHATVQKTQVEVVEQGLDENTLSRIGKEATL